MCSLAFSQNCGTTSCVYFGNSSDEEYKKELDKSNAIFYGEINSQSDVKIDKGFPYRVLKVKVLETWKGIESQETEIQFRYYDNDCANLGESGKFIFYANSPNHEPPFETGWCSKYSFKDEKTRKILGVGKIIEQSQLSQKFISTEFTESFWSTLWRKITSFFS